VGDRARPAGVPSKRAGKPRRARTGARAPAAAPMFVPPAAKTPPAAARRARAGQEIRLPAVTAGLVALVLLGGIFLAARSVAGGRPGRQLTAAVRPVGLTPTAGTLASPSPSPSPSPAPSPPPSPAPVPRTDAAGTVWLCRPGLPANPCAGDLDTTSVSASNVRTVNAASPAAGSRFDCFYVYPTVSLEGAPNADLAVQPAEIDAAVRQVAQFSRLCNVWAPMYRQRTLAAPPSLGFDSQQAAIVEYDSLLSAWKDYLAHFNDGRPIILIGHSTGATVLIQLLQQFFDGNAALRSRLVSALLLGGHPYVAPGSTVGGSFRTIPACRSASQTGCVIAYNSYYGVPPSTSVFGHPAGSALCTNPASLGGGSAPLDTILETRGNSPAGPAVTTTYVEYPGLYTASCVTAGGATYLQITPAAASPGDPRPRLTNNLGADWGLHAYDPNLALGNLLQDVAAEEDAYPPTSG
jgi:hypothetical protein